MYGEKKECKKKPNKVNEKMEIIFYCVGYEVESRKMVTKFCNFFICSQCVFTTAAKRINNKFILNTITIRCSPDQILLQRSSITILWVFTYRHRQTHTFVSLDKIFLHILKSGHVHFCLNLHCHSKILIKWKNLLVPFNPLMDPSPIASAQRS